jgi:protein O-mannosyl-transferase
MSKKQLNTRNSVPDSKRTPTQATTPKGGLRIDLMIVAFILLVTAVIYWPSLKNGFTTFDDNVYVYENQNIEWNTSNLKVLATKEVAGNFHPITMWSLALDHQKIGTKETNPKPYHRTNLLLHLLNTALVFGLVRRLRFSLFVSGMVALLFAIHPMHTESVAWVSSRKDLLYSVFFLSGLIAHTYHQATETKARSIRIWVGVFVLFVLACLSKPAAIVFPLVLWLMDWYQDPKNTNFSKQLLQYAPFLAVSVVFSYLTLQYQHQVGAVADGYFSMIQKTLFAAYGYVIYVVKLFFPTHLSAFHPIPEQGTNLSIMYATLLAGFGLLGGTVWAFLKGHRLWAFGIRFCESWIDSVCGAIYLHELCRVVFNTRCFGRAIFSERGHVASGLGGIGRVVYFSIWVADPRTN